MLCANTQAGAAADEAGAAEDAGGAEAGAIHHDAPMEEALWQVMFRGSCARANNCFVEQCYVLHPHTISITCHAEAPAMGAVGDAGGAGGAPPRRRRQCGVVCGNLQANT
jgi:hypothetical protein